MSGSLRTKLVDGPVNVPDSNTQFVRCANRPFGNFFLLHWDFEVLASWKLSADQVRVFLSHGWRVFDRFTRRVFVGVLGEVALPGAGLDIRYLSVLPGYDLLARHVRVKHLLVIQDHLV